MRLSKMMQSKIDVAVQTASGKIDRILIPGKLYECWESFKTYACALAHQKQFDPNTFDLAPPSLIVKCEDGKERKYQAEHFIDLQAARDEKLNQLGI